MRKAGAVAVAVATETGDDEEDMIRRETTGGGDDDDDDDDDVDNGSRISWLSLARGSLTNLNGEDERDSFRSIPDALVVVFINGLTDSASSTSVVELVVVAVEVAVTTSTGNVRREAGNGLSTREGECRSAPAYALASDT